MELKKLISFTMIDAPLDDILAKLNSLKTRFKRYDIYINLEYNVDTNTSSYVILGKEKSPLLTTK